MNIINYSIQSWVTVLAYFKAAKGRTGPSQGRIRMQSRRLTVTRCKKRYKLIKSTRHLTSGGKNRWHNRQMGLLLNNGNTRIIQGQILMIEIASSINLQLQRTTICSGALTILGEVVPLTSSKTQVRLELDNLPSHFQAVQFTQVNGETV